MRVPVYLMCAALVWAVRGAENSGKLLYQRAAIPEKQLRFLGDYFADPWDYRIPVVEKLSAPPTQEIDRRYFILPEFESSDFYNQRERDMRNKRYETRRSVNPNPPLSIVSNIHALRNSMTKARELEQAQRNREFLENLY